MDFGSDGKQKRREERRKEKREEERDGEQRKRREPRESWRIPINCRKRDIIPERLADN